MNVDFLPEDYEAPKNSNNYMKLLEGENRIRILSAPIIGWEDWTVDKKPVRFKRNERPVKPINENVPVKHFWAMIVYNIKDHRIQILHITQATIRNSIESLYRDDDWGNPVNYDIKITKTGEGKETKYTVNPIPHKPLSQPVIDLFHENPCNLDAVFSNEDPFAKHWINKTPLSINGIPTEKIIEVPMISDEEFIKLGEALNKIPEEERTRIEKKIDSLGVKDISKMPSSMYEMVMHSLDTLMSKK